MGFPADERQRMLKGVGGTVIDRLEQIGFSRLADLAGQDPDGLTRRIAGMMGSTC